MTGASGPGREGDASRLTAQQRSYVDEFLDGDVYYTVGGQTPEQGINFSARITVATWDGGPPVPSVEDVNAYVREQIAAGRLVVRPSRPA